MNIVHTMNSTWTKLFKEKKKTVICQFFSFFFSLTGIIVSYLGCNLRSFQPPEYKTPLPEPTDQKSYGNLLCTEEGVSFSSTK